MPEGLSAPAALAWARGECLAITDLGERVFISLAPAGAEIPYAVVSAAGSGAGDVRTSGGRRVIELVNVQVDIFGPQDGWAVVNNLGCLSDLCLESVGARLTGPVVKGWRIHQALRISQLLMAAPDPSRAILARLIQVYRVHLQPA